MNSQEFIYRVIKLYHSARRPKFPNHKIKRGRSRSISPFLEDLFALFLVDQVRCEKIYVDQPISVSGIKDQNYPDISIVRGGKITSFCDLKTDLGWNRRGLVDLCRHHYRWVQRARGRGCTLKDGVTKEVSLHQISKHASYNVVILSKHNINPELLSTMRTKAKVFSPAVDVFVLTSKEHLNKYGIAPKALLKKVLPPEPDFRELLHKLNA